MIRSEFTKWQETSRVVPKLISSTRPIIVNGNVFIWHAVHLWWNSRVSWFLDNAKLEHLLAKKPSNLDKKRCWIPTIYCICSYHLLHCPLTNGNCNIWLGYMDECFINGERYIAIHPTCRCWCITVYVVKIYVTAFRAMYSRTPWFNVALR